MSEGNNQLWQRRCSLMLFPAPPKAINNPSAFQAGAPEPLELSDMHVTFEVRAEDVQTPNNARIRVENMAHDTVSQIQAQYSRVVLQAGYFNAPFGVIFDGTIKQFAKGRSDAKTTYLDILAADGDLAYNYATVSTTLAAGSTPSQRMGMVVDALAAKGVKPGDVKIPNAGGILPRGKVLFGLARASMRQITQDQGATWTIVNGRLNVTPLDGYLQSEAVLLNAKTGLIGRAEQTEDGVRARCLINPRIRVGGLVQIDNASINVTEQAPEFALPVGQLPYDRYVGVQMFADVSADGLYRVYVIEYKGDTRGSEWYADLTLLAVDPVSGKVR
jgi:hypothetical protein